MLNKNRIISIVIVCAAILATALTGCQTPTKEQPSGSSSQAPAKAPEAPKPITLRITHVQAMTHPYTQIVKDMCAAIEKESNGRLIVKDFPASQLGSEQETLDAVANDGLDMANTAVDVIGKQYAPVIIINSPYVFRDTDHQKKFLASNTVKGWWEDIAKKTNIRVLSTWYYGVRHLSSSKEIRSPKDMAGFKLRVPQAPTNLAFAKAVGASPTPMAVAEVYLALQQKVIDGQENPVPTVIGQKFYEVQKYLVLTGHINQVTAMSISEKKWKSLPDDLKKILQDNLNKYGEIAFKSINDSTVSGINDLKAKGMTIIDPDKAAFKACGDTAIKELAKEFGSQLTDIYNDIQKIQ